MKAQQNACQPPQAPVLQQMTPREMQLMLALMAVENRKVSGSSTSKSTQLDAQHRVLRVFGLSFPIENVAKIIEQLTGHEPYYVCPGTNQTYKFYYIMFQTEQQALHVYRSMGSQRILSPYRIYRSQLVRDLKDVDKLKTCLVVLPNFSEDHILSEPKQTARSDADAYQIPSVASISLLQSNEIEEHVQRAEKLIRETKLQKQRDQAVAHVVTNPILIPRTLVISAPAQLVVKDQIKWRTGFSAVCVPDIRRNRELAIFETQSMAFLAFELLSEWKEARVCFLKRDDDQSVPTALPLTEQSSEQKPNETQMDGIPEQAVPQAVQEPLSIKAPEKEPEIQPVSKNETKQETKLTNQRLEKDQLSSEDDLTVSALTVSLAFK